MEKEVPPTGAAPLLLADGGTLKGVARGAKMNVSIVVSRVIATMFVQIRPSATIAGAPGTNRQIARRKMTNHHRKERAKVSQQWKMQGKGLPVYYLIR